MQNKKSASYQFENKEEIILRDYLALVRTRLANERTLLTYIRFALFLILGGLAFLELDGFEGIKWLVYLAFGISLVSLVIGITKFFYLRNRLKTFYNTPRKM